MKTSMKWLSVLLALCLLVAGVTAIAVAAEAGLITAEAEKDGIRAVLEISDKDYEKTGKMSLALEISNDGGKELKNVKTSITLPASLILKDGELTKNWDAMTYHELAVNEIKFAHLNSPVIPDGTETPDQPDNSGDSDNAEAPNNTSWVLLIVLGVAFVAVVGVVIFLVVSGRIKKGKSLCLLLLVGILLTSLAPAIQAAEEEASNSLTVEQEITIEGEKVTISATVTWEYADPKPANTTLTRADLENAIAEMAWTWYVKGSTYQYDSSTLNALTQHLNDPLCGYCGGKSRLSAYPVMENATSHSSVYTVCSGFAYDTYLSALGYPILGSKFNTLTMTLWRNTSYPDDMAVLRWHTKGKDNNGNVIKYNNYDKTYKVNYDCWYDAAGVYEFFKNYKTTMRPGDIIVYDNPGHAMMYIGNGIVLDANGKKYSMNTGMDALESDGTVDFSTIESKFFDPDNKNYYVGDLGWCENSIVVVRPLDILTIDDGDNDPSNDKLDPNYTLDTGLLKAQLASDKTHTIKTSGYGIDDVTYTRLKYPAMTIDRTSSITPYGTAAQGATITYSVVVTNNSNTANYITYKQLGGDANYAGVNYDELWVLEQIPEGTTLESAIGAIIDGNTLRWNCQLDAGESRTFAYTVRVTGNVGDVITSTGGWVANIPSNTISNLIGGKKLPNNVSGKMANLFEAGRDAWNSNDGYKISANVKSGTKFAERIYQITTGLDLQLPDVQEIMNIFFHEQKVTEPYGLYLYHESSGVTRYMYSLNDKAPNAADQIYYNMLVPGYYGGLWCYTDETNGEPRINELRAEYLEPGDVLIYMDLTDAAEDGAVSKTRKVEGWTVLVYFGGDTYMSLNDLGRLDPVNNSFGRTQAFSHDLFVCLRPRQAYTDINKEVPAFTGTAPDLTEEDKRQTYVPNPSDVLLNASGCSQFANLSIKDYEWIKVNGVFPGEVYGKLGIDIVTNGTDDASFATLLKNLFIDMEDDSQEYREFGHHYFWETEPKYGAEKQYEMLLYYGGPAFADQKPISSMNDLHPGDIVMLGSRTARFYVTTIYQGDGNFLLNVQSLALAGIESKIWDELHFANNKEFMDWLNCSIATFAETLDKRDRFDPTNPNVASFRYEGYLVMRPSRAFANINSMVQRSIDDAPLASAEEKALSALTPEQWLEGGKKYNLGAASTWIYGRAGINTTVYLGSNSVFAARNLLFKWAGNYMQLIHSTETGYDKNYRIMLVPGAYGGTSFVQSKTFVPGDFEIGDLFCGAQGASIHGGSGTRYVVAVYQGNGKFLVIENGGPLGITAHNDSAMFFSENIGKEWNYYYVLRPDRLATIDKVEDEAPVTPPDTPVEPEKPTIRDIADHKLTEAEKKALAELVIGTSNCGGSIDLGGILPGVYKAINIDITTYPGYKSVSGNNFRKALFGDETVLELIPVDPNDATSVYYHKLLVEGFYGGTKFAASADITADKLQIGDIFMARIGKNVETPNITFGNSNSYYVLVYQGNGNFAGGVNIYTPDNEKTWKTMTVAELQALQSYFEYYLVIRPEQLSDIPAPVEPPVEPEQPEEPVIRDIADHKLTEAEKKALAELVIGKDNCGGTIDLGGILPGVYKAINIDITTYPGYTSVSGNNFRKALFGDETVLELIPVDPNDATSVYYHKLLVEGFYGGTKFAASADITADKLQIGDIFMARIGKNVETPNITFGNSNSYYVLVYQGNGNFAGGVNIYTPDNEKTWKTMTVAELQALQSYFEYYLVIRPEQLAETADPEEPPVNPEQPEQPEQPEEPVIRDIATGKLTEAEKNALAAIDPSAWDASLGYNLNKMFTWMYAQANVDVTKTAGYAEKTVNDVVRYMFNTGVSPYGDMVVDANDATKTYYQTMFCDAGFGGTGVAAQSALDQNKLQIGDLVCGRIKNGSTSYYYVCLYQGNGNFLCTYSDAAGSYCAVMDLSAVSAVDFYYFYTMRPEQLAA